jgi:hypothetical protein
VHDFTIYWRATVNFVSGLNPYDLPHYGQYLEACAPVSRAEPNMKAWGPPWMFALLAPVGALSLSAAKQVYLVGWYFSIAVSLFCLGRVYGVTLAGKGRSVCDSVVFLPLGIWWSSLQWGSPTWLVLLGISLFLHASARGKDFLGGFALTLGFLKVHILFPFYLGVVCRAGVEKRFGIWLGILSGAGFLAIVLALLNPGALRNFFEMFGSRDLDGLTSASVPSIIRGFYPGYGPLAGLLGGGAVSILMAAAARGHSFAWLAAVGLPLSLALGPFAWGHDYIICLPTCFFIAARIWSAEEDSLLRRVVTAEMLFVNILAFALSAIFNVPGWWYVAYGLGLCALVLRVLGPDVTSIQSEQHPSS